MHGDKYQIYIGYVRNVVVAMQDATQTVHKSQIGVAPVSWTVTDLCNGGALVSPFVVDGGQIVEGGMPSPGIVPAFDEAEDVGARLVMVLPASPTDPMEGRTPVSWHCRPKASEVYCEPWSE